jgi:hypothetical protein
MTLTQTQAHELTRTSYGGSDPTLPSFLRPYYVKYNAVSKSRDLGQTDILIADLTGEIGSEAGSNTLYFKVAVRKLSSGASTDRFLSVGILDAERKPIPLDTSGYATECDIHGTDAYENLLGVPAGTYYVTVSSSQWQRIPFAIAIAVGRYALLDGAARGSFSPVGRIPLVKPTGQADGTAPLSGTLLRPNVIKNATGSAGGTALPTLALSILRGAVIGTMVPSGRLMMNWKLSGVASGSAQSQGTLSSESPYGGGYGY